MLNNRHGVALVTTLWILAALVVLAIGIGLMARTEAQVSYNFGGLIQCRWAARAGVNRALIEIERLKGEQTVYLGEDALVLSSEQDDIDLGDASFDVRIEDEAGRVNINAAPRAVLESLFGSRDIADCITDWRDGNDEPRPLGAETQHYSALAQPYRCKNKPFDTVQELLLVKDITDDLLSQPLDESGRTLVDLLTVYSHDENTAVDGSERTNIQTASKEDLQAEFGDTLTERDIDAIIRYRERRTFNRAGEVIRVRELGRDKVSRIYDRITARSGAGSGSNSNSVAGLVNVNTASVEVLAALPGMDQGIAQEIVRHRQSNGAFADVGKILDVAGVTESAFAQAADRMTVRSSVFRIISTGRIALSRISYVVTCVVDLSGDQVQTKYWRE